MYKNWHVKPELCGFYAPVQTSIARYGAAPAEIVSDRLCVLSADMEFVIIVECRL